jgi:hypothetical protein
LVLAQVALALYGWRFGFTALPVPVPDAEPVALTEVTAATLGTNHIWYWVCELDRSKAIDRRGLLQAIRALDAWASTGALADSDNVALGRFFDANPDLVACATAIATATHGPKHTVAGLNWRRFAPAHQALVFNALWRACRAERAGDPTGAWTNLVEAWRLQMLEGGRWWPQRPIQGTLAFAGRRLALEGPALSADDGHRVLDQLERIRADWPPLELNFAAALQPDTIPGVPASAMTEPTVSRRFAHALGAMARETAAAVRLLFARLSGLSPPASPPEAQGWRHLIEPVSLAVRALAGRVGRLEDAQQVRRAYVTQVIAALRRGTEAEAVALSDALRARCLDRSWWPRWFDRPSAHEAILRHTSLAPLAFERHRTEAALESCRLVLALRLYRDRHGHWPDQCADLVPDFLAALPVNPFTGRPFGYERTGDDWLVRADVEGAGAPDALEDGVLFRSRDLDDDVETNPAPLGP